MPLVLTLRAGPMVWPDVRLTPYRTTGPTADSTDVPARQFG
jgi:hypothetical protein